TGIVGARRCTEYGKRIATEAAEFLAERGIAVISGMAKGIDGYAHTACINSGGYTIAFLGCGIDIAYPEEHRKLMEKIKETGAVISEYPPGTKPNGKNFPERNRLIAAFSKELLVVEAGENSGALITADFAKKYKRTVFAAPNNIFLKESEGTNKLILNGSEVYLCPKQLLKEFPEVKSESAQQKNINRKVMEEIISDSVEKMILESLNKEPKTIDELKIIINNEEIDIVEKLSLMELDGKVIIRAGLVSTI
ncbi:MAG: DNA-processing protein DprA, partial [Clostridiaceae bacterium]